MPDSESRSPIQTTLRRLVIATVVLYLVTVGGIFYVYSTADETTGALCALRSDLERRVETSQQFLIENPNGIPGIPPRTIRDSIKNQKRTIDALSDLSC